MQRANNPWLQRRFPGAFLIAILAVLALNPQMALSAETGEAKGDAVATTAQAQSEAEPDLAGQATLASGSCGDRLTYVLSDLGWLTISGSGEMTSAPWRDYAEQLVYVYLPSGMTSLANEAFRDCENLRKVSIEDGSSLSTIGSFAFAGCKSLEEIGSLNSVQKMGSRVFQDTPITSFTLPVFLMGCEHQYKNELEGGPLAGAPGLRKVIVPDGMTHIPSYLLYKSFWVNTMVIPKSVRTVGYGCSWGSNVSSVEYAGSKSNWEMIDFGDGYHNDELINAHVSYGEVSVSDLTIKDIPTQTYCGEPLAPSLVVTYEGNTLTEDVDYRVTYKNNTTPGVAAAVLSGMGTFAGTRSVSFTIMGDLSVVEVDPIPVRNYVGREVKPYVRASFAGASLAEGVDYRVSYADNNAVGTGKVMLTGLGVWQGTKEATFKIEKAVASKFVVSGVKSAVYTGKAIKPKVTVKASDGSWLKEDSHYLVSYENNVKAGKGRIIITGIGTCSGSKTVTFKIAKASVTSAKVSKIAVLRYKKGRAAKPNPTVKVAGRTLRKGTDYKLTYKNNKKRGIATVTITGKGNYVGKKVVKFKIK